MMRDVPTPSRVELDELDFVFTHMVLTTLDIREAEGADQLEVTLRLCDSWSTASLEVDETTGFIVLRQIPSPEPLASLEVDEATGLIVLRQLRSEPQDGNTLIELSLEFLEHGV